MSLRGRSDPGSMQAGLRQFLIVGCGKTRFALPADAVRGLHEGEQAAPHASADRQPVDLGERLGLGRGPAAPPPTVVLLGADSEVEVFGVDEVVGLVEVAPQEIRALPAHFSGSERTRLAGLFLFEDGLALVVNLWWLLRREQGPHAAGTWLEAAPAATLEGSGVEEASDGEDAPWAEI